MPDKDELKKMRSDAQKTVAGFAAAAAASCAVAIPIADAVVLVGEQVTMMTGISTIYKLGFSKKTLQTLVVGALGAGGMSIVGKTIVANTFKAIPGIGTVAGGVISSTTAGTLTFALGNAFIELCEAVKKEILTEEDLVGDKGKDYFKKLFNRSIEEKRVTKIEYEKPKGQGFLNVLKCCDAIKDGQRGQLIWDQGLWNEITFYAVETKTTESLYQCLSDKEAEEKFNELARKYKPLEEKNTESLKNHLGASEIIIQGLNRLKDMEPRTGSSLEIHIDDKAIGYVEVISDGKNNFTIKEININEDFRGKGICSEVIRRLKSLYSVELTETVIEDMPVLD